MCAMWEKRVFFVYVRKKGVFVYVPNKNEDVMSGRAVYRVRAGGEESSINHFFQFIFCFYF